MRDTSLHAPNFFDNESSQLTESMVTIANNFHDIKGIDDFGKTGWLPEEFFTLLHDFYKVYDRYIYHNTIEANIQIICKKTCDRCCCQPVMGLYAFEIVNMYRQLRPRDDYKDIHNLFVKQASDFQQAVARYVESGTEAISSGHPAIIQAHNDLAEAAHPCPLLCDGMCKIYEHRPVTCRMYHSLTDPALCTSADGKTFAVEPPQLANTILWELSDRLNISGSEILAQEIVLFGFERKFREWEAPS
jgi:Fe-S-cluster containining protein